MPSTNNAIYSDRVLNALHLALCSHAVYFYVITNYANPLALDSVVWSFRVSLRALLFFVNTDPRLQLQMITSVSTPSGNSLSHTQLLRLLS